MKNEKHYNDGKRQMLNKLGLAVLVMLLGCLGLFSQSANSNKGKKLGLGKLEPFVGDEIVLQIEVEAY